MLWVGQGVTQDARGIGKGGTGIGRDGKETGEA